MEKLLTQAEVASYIGMSESWLAWHRWKGDSIPFLKIGRSVRYRLSDIQSWIDQHQRRNSTIEGGH